MKLISKVFFLGQTIVLILGLSCIGFKFMVPDKWVDILHGIGIAFLTTSLITIFNRWLQFDDASKGKTEAQNDFSTGFVNAIKRSGITGIYPNSMHNYKAIHHKLNDLIKTDKIQRIKIIAYHGYHLFQDLENKLIEAIKKEAKVSIIISDFESDIVKNVQILEKNNSDDHQKALDIIRRIKEKTDNEKNPCEYKLCGNQIRYALIMINNEWGWWTPYQPGQRVSETTSFILEKSDEDNSILSQCYNHFKTLWRVSPPII